MVRFGARMLALIGCALAFAAWIPTSASAAISLFWEPSASLFWTINEPAIMNLFQNGECTELAATRRPDVVRQIVLGFIGKDIARGQAEAVPNFEARYWASDAAVVGIPTGNTPKVGSLIDFQPGVLGAASAGHIAYVVAVHQRSFTIAEMNAPFPYRQTYRTLRMYDRRLPGVTFIY
jgi:hypothetical protein